MTMMKIYLSIINVYQTISLLYIFIIRLFIISEFYFSISLHEILQLLFLINWQLYANTLHNTPKNHLHIYNVVFKTKLQVFKVNLILLTK